MLADLTQESLDRTVASWLDEALAPLPDALVERLRDAVERRGESRAFRYLGRLANVDHRAGDVPNPRLVSTENWGGRVRAFDVSRNYGRRVAVKRAHTFDAENTIAHVDSLVERVPRFDGISLVRIPAYAISRWLIAMPSVSAPSVTEIREMYLSADSGRGRVMKEYLDGQGLYPHFLQATLLLSNVKMYSSNMWFLGAKDGRLVFAPHIDPF